MVKVENYPNAYKEVYVILKNMREEERNLVPKSFMQMIEKNMNEQYDFKLDKNIDFQDQKLLRETRTILAYIFLNFWATKKQKDRIEKKFRQDIVDFENSKSEYNQDELFKNRKSKSKESNLEVKTKTEELHMIEQKEESFFKRLLRKIKKILDR